MNPNKRRGVSARMNQVPCSFRRRRRLPGLYVVVASRARLMCLRANRWTLGNGTMMMTTMFAWRWRGQLSGGMRTTQGMGASRPLVGGARLLRQDRPPTKEGVCRSWRGCRRAVLLCKWELSRENVGRQSGVEFTSAAAKSSAAQPAPPAQTARRIVRGVWRRRA